jgi:hypothetical protein
LKGPMTYSRLKTPKTINWPTWTIYGGENPSRQNRSHLFSMEDSKNSVASRWQEQPPLKTIFISVLWMKSSSTWLIPTSLCKGPIFLLLCWVNLFSLYLKQAFELLWSNHPYVDLFNHVYYLPLFSMMFLSDEYIFGSYLWL